MPTPALARPEQPVRVLHVMESTIGGTRRHLADVAEGQLALGLEVELAVSLEREPRFRTDLERLARLGARVHELPMVRAIRPATDLGHLRRLAVLLRARRPEIVHTHSSKAGALGRWASLRAGVGRRVHTPHTFAFLFEAMFGPAKRALFRAVERSLARSTHAFVAVSADEAESFRRAGFVPAERVHVVHNGIDPRPFEEARPLARAELGFDPDRPLALVVGLFNRAKGQDLALRALAEPGLERLQLALVGEGEDRALLEGLTRELGLGGRVRFLGWREDVPRLLATADWLVLPSRWEGLPYVLLEALASSLPVVATPVDGARGLLGASGAGIAAASIDAGALAAALRAALALEPAERRARGLRGRALVLAEHGRERMVQGLAAVYRAALEGA